MGKEEYEYTAKDIQVLEGLEAVRKRPAMYIGDVGKRGFHHLVFEIVDNSIDEALAGYADHIIVRIKNGNIAEIEDNGRGIPTDMHPSGKNALELVSTTLHAGGKFQKKAYKVSGGLHGVGISVVNALSEWMEIQVFREGKIFRQKYERGKPITGVDVIGTTSKRGTLVRFKPDPEIFGEQRFDPELLANRLEELSFLNKGVNIVFEDEEGNRKEFLHEGGIKEFVEKLARHREKLHEPICGERKDEKNEAEFSLLYTKSFSATILSFVNSIRTIEGGTHVSGFKSGLTRAINDYGKKNGMLKDKRLSGEDVLEGLVAIINMRVAEPQFEGQTKTKLGNSEIKGLVDSCVYETVKRYLEENPNEAKVIMQRCIQTMEAREAAKKAKEMVRRKSVLESSILPGKLADCIEKNPEMAELFIVEGDSAGGSAKQGRDRKFQAILPLRGKILNVEKANMRKILENNEIKALITSLGCGFGENLNLANLRYHKIIIMTDADVDGAHIRTLLLTLFYRYFLPLIEKGYIYIATPPLYKIKKGKQQIYAYSDEEMQRIIKEFSNQHVEIQRYKGLGEMNPQQLWETTMDPKTRFLKKVTIEDAEKADELFTILMGEDVDARRQFIQKYAKEVKNLDI